MAEANHMEEDDPIEDVRDDLADIKDSLEAIATDAWWCGLAAKVFLGLVVLTVVVTLLGLLSTILE